MILFKKISLVLIIILVIIQFIQPVRNQYGQVLDTDISKTVSVPENVQTILKYSCYDCHSNTTHYPWYFNIQPMAWLMARHIKNGKEKLNFSEFGSYTKRRQESKLKSIAKQIENDVMPLTSYTLLHRNAILSTQQKDNVINWVNKNLNQLNNEAN